MFLDPAIVWALFVKVPELSGAPLSSGAVFKPAPPPDNSL
jgi:hypothetical protein